MASLLLANEILHRVIVVEIMIHKNLRTCCHTHQPEDVPVGDGSVQVDPGRELVHDPVTEGREESSGDAAPVQQPQVPHLPGPVHQLRVGQGPVDPHHYRGI